MSGDHEREVHPRGDGGEMSEGDEAGQLTVAVAGTPPVITVAGELTLETSPLLAAEVAGVVASGELGVMVFDLARVTFLDSSGLTVLVDAAARCGSVAVRNPSSVVRRIIEATGLTDVLRVEA